ncbi:hypothetical protein K438DRAFT_1988873 [Mycena galopus ATCC 62051]|nr:hypothetical protein K438DRAFT_1988873 [Mycena galopus ATCC 62051]
MGPGSLKTSGIPPRAKSAFFRRKLEFRARIPGCDSPMVPPSEDDKVLGSPVPATVRDTCRSKRGKAEVSEPELLDVPPAKKLKGKPGPKPKKKPATKKAQDSSDDAEVPSHPEPPVKKPKQSRHISSLLLLFFNLTV